jgi:hypothetical protein
MGEVAQGPRVRPGSQKNYWYATAVELSLSLLLRHL